MTKDLEKLERAPMSPFVISPDSWVDQGEMFPAHSSSKCAGPGGVSFPSLRVCKLAVRECWGYPGCGGGAWHELANAPIPCAGAGPRHSIQGEQWCRTSEATILQARAEAGQDSAKGQKGGTSRL